MATKTFSSRADEQDLAYADAIARKQFGMSFGQYCGSILLNAVRQGAELPTPISDAASTKKANAISKIKSFSQREHDSSIGKMTDSEIRDLIASRYE